MWPTKSSWISLLRSRSLPNSLVVREEDRSRSKEERYEDRSRSKGKEERNEDSGRKSNGEDHVKNNSSIPSDMQHLMQLTIKKHRGKITLDTFDPMLQSRMKKEPTRGTAMLNYLLGLPSEFVPNVSPHDVDR